MPSYKTLKKILAVFIALSMIGLYTVIDFAFHVIMMAADKIISVI